MECWFNESEALPPNTMIATQANSWISDEIAPQWLQSFIKATNERTKRGEKRILMAMAPISLLNSYAHVKIMALYPLHSFLIQHIFASH